MTSVRVVVRSLEGFTETLIKRIALNVTANLIQDTPVDTGWARANWVPQIGSPRSTASGTRPENGGTARTGDQEAGISSVLTYKLGPSIHITNNVPYIQKLNSGTSQQAPAAFVQSAILRAVKQTVSSAS